MAEPTRDASAREAELALVADPFVGTYAAARRRDLTMNALYEDVLTGEIVDYFGGRDDLANGVIRHVDEQTFPRTRSACCEWRSLRRAST